MTRHQPRFAIAACALLLMSLIQESRAATPQGAIEAALAAAQETKRGITVQVGGQPLGGAVVRIEPGVAVELRGPQGSKITIRIDRIDAVVQP